MYMYVNRDLLDPTRRRLGCNAEISEAKTVYIRLEEEEDILRANRQNTVDIDSPFFTYFSRSRALASSNGKTAAFTDSISIFIGDRIKNTARIVVFVTLRW